MKIIKSIVTEQKNEPFHKLMSSQLRQMYEAKLLDAPAYILLIVQCHGAAGWKWTFKVKDFCKEWGIPRPTFYRAVSKLKTLGLLHWEAGDTLTVWHGADIARDSLTDETTSLTGDNPILTDETALSPLRLKIAETPAVTESCDAPDYIQSKFRSTNNTVVVGKNDFVEEEEIDQVAGIVAQPAAAPTPEIEVDDLEQPEQVLLTSEEISTALTRLRAMGLTLNPTIRNTVKNYYDAVEGAIGHIKERIASGEKFRSIEGAFVKACKENAKPSSNVLDGGIPAEVNPPTIEQLVAIEQAKTAGTIRDYYLSSEGVTKVVMPNGIHIQTWWEFLGLELP